MTLNELSKIIREVNYENGWKPVELADWAVSHKIPAVLALIHSEVSEALEAFRVNDLENFKEELADVLIRVLDCAGGLTHDFDAVVQAKIEKNRTRGFRHGGKKV